MDAKMRDIILDKLVYMKRQIGYPDSYSNITIVKEHFRGVSFDCSFYSECRFVILLQSIYNQFLAECY